MDSDSRRLVHQLLQRGVWFSGLPSALQALILDRSVIRSYRKGEFLIREGEPPKAMFAVLEGQIRVIRQVGDGDEILLHIGEPGSWCGEYGVYSGALSIGSIVAHSKLHTLMLTVQQFERIVGDEPRYFRAFAGLLMEHFALMFRYIAEGRCLSPEDRLCTRLADLAAMQRHHRPPERPVDLTISQADIATMIGVSRQTLNALLSRLQAKGLIEVGFRRVRVIDESGLRGARSCGNWPAVNRTAGSPPDQPKQLPQAGFEGPR